MEKPSRDFRRVWLARGLAMAADLLEIVVFPVFAPGIASPVADALDLAMAGLLTALLGWHWAFLPSFVVEVVPGLTLVPTWTAAAFFVTRGEGRRPASPETAREGAIETQVVKRG
ncbi:MAG TPA: hypothetical protein VIB08_07205 [Thermoanaerobaculia bacterium]